MLTINTKNTTYHQSIVKIFQLDISSNDAMGKLWAAGPPNWTNFCGPETRFDGIRRWELGCGMGLVLGKSSQKNHENTMEKYANSLGKYGAKPIGHVRVFPCEDHATRVG